MIFALVISMGLGLAIPLFTGLSTQDSGINNEEVVNWYYNFTDSVPSSESVWVLKGIYTPYGVNADGQPDTTHYGYTDDGWLYGYRIENYTPSQYGGTVQSYSVTYKPEEGMYRYATDTDYGNHKAGDLYTNVSMSKDKQSQIFFTPDMKTEQGDYFYYNFSGYRYSFCPTSDFRTIDSDGNKIDVISTSTSLSLIWYNYYVEEQSGISGQLIISSQDYEVAYLTAAEIITAFNSTTSTSKFVLNFLGVPINLYIRLDPTMIQQGMSVQECYNLGYWSVMVTATATDIDAYTSSSYAFDPAKILETVINLFTFHYTDYNMSPTMGVICSLLIVIPFYAILLALMVGTDTYKMVLLAGLIAAVQAIATLFNNVGWPF